MCDFTRGVRAHDVFRAALDAGESIEVDEFGERAFADVEEG